MNLFGRKKTRKTKKTPTAPSAPRARIAPTADWTKAPGEVIVLRDSPLSMREMEVLLLMSDGLTNSEIGVELYISEETVKTHARRVIGKLGARSRAHAVSLAFRRGMLTTGSRARSTDLSA